MNACGRRLRWFGLWLVAMGVPVAASAETNITEQPSEWTWTAAGSPYVVHTTIAVPNDQVLTVQSGVRIEFASRTSITVFGAVDIQGTEAAPVVITNLDAGDVASTFFTFGNTPMSSVIRHAHLSGARSSAISGNLQQLQIEGSRFSDNGTAITLSFGNLLIDTSIFQDNARAIQAVSIGNFVLHNSVVRDSTQTGVLVTVNGPADVREITHCTFDNNGSDVAGGSIGVLVDADDAGSLVVSNSIITNSFSGALQTANATLAEPFLQLEFSDVWNNTIDYSEEVGLGAGMLSADPQYADSTLQLALTSPARDAANVLASIGLSLNGLARPQGSGPDMGAYERATECGNRVIEPPEQCDDGNDDEFDGCDSECMQPDCGNGVLDPGEDCDDGNISNADACPSNCIFARCGDGVLLPGVEECDDGNDIDGDGCSQLCTLESVEQPGPGIDVSGSGCSLQATRIHGAAWLGALGLLCAIAFRRRARA